MAEMQSRFGGRYRLKGFPDSGACTRSRRARSRNRPGASDR